MAVTNIRLGSLVGIAIRAVERSKRASRTAIAEHIVVRFVM
jgi:hypothetical protein